MLSLFPSLLSWQLAAPFVVRLVLGAAFMYWSYRGLRDASSSAGHKALSAIEGVSGILVFIGFLTQLASLVMLIDLIVRIVGKIVKRRFLTDGVNYYLVLAALAFTLLVSGAGWLAFDLSL